MDEPRLDDFSDEALDAVLAAGDEALLDHVRAHADPTQTLAALLAEPGDLASDRGAVGVSPSSVAHRPKRQIRDRVQAWGFYHEIADICDLAAVFNWVSNIHDADHLARAVRLLCVRALDLDHVVESAPQGAHGRAIKVLRLLRRSLDHAAAHARDLVLALGPVRTDKYLRLPHLSGELTEDLGRALAHAHAFARLFLRSMEIDASGLDLTDVRLPDRDRDMVLTRVVWDVDTRWPADVHAWLQVRSEEIEPGVFRLRGGTERDPHESAGV
ncbi:hypothetical protein [Actinomadura roseirufa]|uniref:hypothetical protein n=1 Tax=Actinomadura roseirufa TaxID=2094049 RepID=UPI00104181C5|nr:hypothetical protein [Actinomadura roseirufa]